MPITSTTLYNELVPTGSAAATENPGVKALKQFHLKEPEVYDSGVRDKIFSIGQNNMQGAE